MATARMSTYFQTQRQNALLKVKRNDKRYAGYDNFAYRLDCATSGANNFFELRAWCWATWGPSKALRDWEMHDRLVQFSGEICQNSNWSWMDDARRYRILFKTKEDAALFTLSTGL